MNSYTWVHQCSPTSEDLHTYIQCEHWTYQERWTIGTNGQRESGHSIVTARFDDDDDDDDDDDAIFHNIFLQT